MNPVQFNDKVEPLKKPCLWLPVVLPPLAAVPASADGEGTARQQEAQPVLGPGLLKKPLGTIEME